MRCTGCRDAADGYAVIPGLGDAGEIRFYCDGCARRDRVKMRYWDARDLDIGGHRDNPDLGPSFGTLVFAFEDLARVRVPDLALVLEWVDDAELAAALVGASNAVVQRVFTALSTTRVRRVRDLLAAGRPARDPGDAKESIVRTVRRL